MLLLRELHGGKREGAHRAAASSLDIPQCWHEPRPTGAPIRLSVSQLGPSFRPVLGSRGHPADPLRRLGPGLYRVLPGWLAGSQTLPQEFTNETTRLRAS